MTTTTTSRYRKIRQASRRDSRPAAIACSLFVLLCISVAYTFYPSSPTNSISSVTSINHPDVSLRGITTVRAVGYDANYCNGPNPSNFLSSSHRAWLVLLIPGVLFLFTGLAIVTDDYFVPALEQICEQLNLSEDVAGATFMAAGSSAPELFTALLGALWTKDDVGIGTIVGSAVFNILIIIGLSGALAKTPLDLDFRPLLRDSAFYIISIIMLIIFVMFVGGHTDKLGNYQLAGKLNWWEGLIFVFAYGVYILFMAYGNKPYLTWMEKKFRKPSTGADIETPVANGGDAIVTEPSPSTNQAPEMLVHTSQPIASQISSQNNSISAHAQSSLERRASKYSELNPRSHIRVITYAMMFALPPQSSPDETDAATAVVAVEEERRPPLCCGIGKKPKTALQWMSIPFMFPWNFAYKYTILDCSIDRFAKWWPLTFAISIVWIMIISFLMVEATRLSGCFIGIPSAVMGLTFLAAGTSVPDALASVAVARNGFGNMAVSNAIGSNVFDIFLGLGLPWFLAGLILEEGVSTVTVFPLHIIIVPIAILFAVIVALIGLLFVMKWRLSRSLGYILFGLYGLFIIYGLLSAFVFPE